ncbi:hypothetical protein GCM10010096_34680 [Alcaligenes pakistanensis]|uniref:Uncharacterized protein n=1 Tax=Alcaligenes pakistanensis TaxID=1482717 RepID=A0A8H9M6B3_9BURK|nr:hypothetical protein GCM10010096_34680 [Alcaligenes pakistanensis]
MYCFGVTLRREHESGDGGWLQIPAWLLCPGSPSTACRAWASPSLADFPSVTATTAYALCLRVLLTIIKAGRA